MWHDIPTDVEVVGKYRAITPWDWLIHGVDVSIFASDVADMATAARVRAGVDNAQPDDKSTAIDRVVGLCVKTEQDLTSDQKSTLFFLIILKTLKLPGPLRVDKSRLEILDHVARRYGVSPHKMLTQTMRDFMVDFGAAAAGMEADTKTASEAAASGNYRVVTAL